MIAKIDGKYWMYWGEKFVNVSTSTDLVNWEPMLDENGEFLKVMTPRAGKFDSDLTECGPPAILTDKGILLFYNGKNKSGAEGDTLYTANSYCAGQALFDAKNPTKLIDRLDKPFYIPESDFEKERTISSRNRIYRRTCILQSEMVLILWLCRFTRGSCRI